MPDAPRRALLVGPGGSVGGEATYADLVARNPPEGWAYVEAGPFHRGAPGARCAVPYEVALNRVVRPLTIPDMGLRALRVAGDFDLVHVHAHPAWLSAPPSMPVVMSEGSSSAVYLASYVGWSDGEIGRRFRRARRLYRALGVRDRLLNLERVARVYVFSEWARGVNIGWGADPAKLSVVAPGFPVPPVPARDDRTEFRFLFLGTDFARKGGFDVVEAFAAACEAVPWARLRIVSPDVEAPSPDFLARPWVGAARRARLVSVLRRLVDEGRAEVGPLLDDPRAVSAAYAEADAFVMPSLAEGFGFTNVEAMGHALPVISTTFGPIPEVVQQGVTGVLVEPGDVDALAEAMVELAAHPAAAREMGARGRADFEARFTLDTMRSGLQKVYEEAAG